MNKDGVEAVVLLKGGTVCVLNFVPDLGDEVEGWMHDENGNLIEARGIVTEILELV